MLVQHRILHPSFFSLPKREISLPKVIIIVRHHEALEFQNFDSMPVSMLLLKWTRHRQVWLEKQHPPAILHAGALGWPAQGPEHLPEAGRTFLAELTAHWQCGFPWPGAGLVGATGAVQGRALPLCPCCCHLVLLLPSYLLGSRTEALIYYT